MLTFLEGKKTYAIAAVTFIVAGLQAIGYPIPDWAFAILGSLGLGTLRSGQKTEARNAALATAATIAPEATAAAMASLKS